MALLSRLHSCCAVRLVYIQISPGHIWTTLYNLRACDRPWWRKYVMNFSLYTVFCSLLYTMNSSEHLLFIHTQYNTHTITLTLMLHSNHRTNTRTRVHALSTNWNWTKCKRRSPPRSNSLCLIENITFMCSCYRKFGYSDLMNDFIRTKPVKFESVRVEDGY